MQWWYTRSPCRLARRSRPCMSSLIFLWEKTSKKRAKMRKWGITCFTATSALATAPAAAFWATRAALVFGAPGTPFDVLACFDWEEDPSPCDATSIEQHSNRTVALRIIPLAWVEVNFFCDDVLQKMWVWVWVLVPNFERTFFQVPKATLCVRERRCVLCSCYKLRYSACPEWLNKRPLDRCFCRTFISYNKTMIRRNKLQHHFLRHSTSALEETLVGTTYVCLRGVLMICCFMISLWACNKRINILFFFERSVHISMGIWSSHAHSPPQ